MKAFKTQLYPYKEHPEIIKDMFGYRFKKSLDSLFPIFDYISDPILEIGFWKTKYCIIQKGNLFGVIKEDGSIFIEPQFVQIIPTENDKLLLLNTDFKWGLKGVVKEGFEKQLNYSIPCAFDEIGEYSEGFYTVQLDGLFGFAPLVKENLNIYPQYEAIKPFHEGLAAIKKNGKWGFIDKTMNYITKLEFDNVESFVKGLAVVWKGERKYQIDFAGNDNDGREHISDSDYKRVGSFSEGLCAVTKDGRLGFIDYLGNIVIPLEYGEVGLCKDAPIFSEGFACVRKGHYWGYIDKQNRTVLPFVFDDYRPIHNGTTFVHDGNRINFQQLLTCKHFFDYSHGNKIPFRLERKPPEPRYDYYDTGWSRRDLQDAYEAAYEI